MKCLKVTTLSILLLGLVTQTMAKEPLGAVRTKSDPYPFLRSVDIYKLPKKLRAKYHLEMTNILVEFEKKESFPNIQKTKFSYMNFLDSMSKLLIDESIADNHNVCLFGGWPSRQSGTCSLPWSASSRTMASSLETNGYTSEYYCGDDNLFRCNPLVFGPGIDPAQARSYPNVNGRRNNAGPEYASGICVEKNGSYNGISERCHEVSTALDRIRASRGEPSWRESDFFNLERAQAFRNLQSVITEKCREERERLNSDNMCSALDAQLGMTAAAVEAGNMPGMVATDLFPQCATTTPALPACNSETHDSFRPMIQAMDELRSMAGCSFMGVHAVDSESLGHMMEFNPQCRSSVDGIFKSSGIPADGRQFTFYFQGGEGSERQRMTLDITPSMTKEEIVAALTGGPNRATFNGICENTACPRITDESLGLSNLYEALDMIKNNPRCDVGSIQAVDREFSMYRSFKPNTCALSVSGHLASEGLPNRESESGPVPVVVLLSNRQGEQIARMNINIMAEYPAGVIYNQLMAQNLMQTCMDANQSSTGDMEQVARDLGIPEGTFIPEVYREGDFLGKLRNIIGDKDVQVSIGEDGSILLTGPDASDLRGQVRSLVSSSEQFDDYRRARLFGGSKDLVVREGDNIRIVATPPVQVEVAANNGGATLTEQERATLTEVIQREGMEFDAVTRSEDGVLAFTVPGHLTEATARAGSVAGYDVQTEAPSGGRAGIVRVNLVPLTESGEPIREVASGPRPLDTSHLTCYEEGQNVPKRDNNGGRCCEGLTMEPNSNSMYKGTCRRPASSCFTAGQRVPNGSGATCCDGLLLRSEPESERYSGVCVDGASVMRPASRPEVLTDAQGRPLESVRPQPRPWNGALASVEDIPDYIANDNSFGSSVDYLDHLFDENIRLQQVQTVGSGNDRRVRFRAIRPVGGQLTAETLGGLIDSRTNSMCIRAVADPEAPQGTDSYEIVTGLGVGTSTGICQ